jgi:hypothetical protein
VAARKRNSIKTKDFDFFLPSWENSIGNILDSRSSGAYRGGVFRARIDPMASYLILGAGTGRLA